MTIFLAIILMIFICFAFVVFFGAPYVPTLKKQQEQALSLLDLKKGQTLLELGSGDGRLLKLAASRGIKVVGYELNPILYFVSRIKTRQYRQLVTINFADYWLAKWPLTDGIYVFLTQHYMSKLDKKIIQSKIKNVKLVSYAARIPNKQSDKRQGPMFLYKY